MPHKLKLASLLFAATLAACGGSDDTAGPAPAPSPAPSPAPDTAADCHYDSLMNAGVDRLKAGVEYATTYRWLISPVPSGPYNEQIVTKISSGGSFRGTDGLLVISREVAGALPTNTKTHEYAGFDGDVPLTHGSMTTYFSGIADQSPVSSKRYEAYDPPLRGMPNPLDLRPGQSITVNANTTLSIYGENGPPIGSTTAPPTTVQYIGKETITVAAGTFEACHFLVNGDDTWNAPSLGGVTIKVLNMSRPLHKELVKFELLSPPSR